MSTTAEQEALTGLHLIQKALSVIRRHHPALEGWKLGADPKAVTAEIRFRGGGARAVRFEHASPEAAWMRTPSFNISLVGKIEHGMNAEEESVLSQLTRLIQQRDPGGLRLPLPAPAVDPRTSDRAALAPEVEQQREERAIVARQEFADEIRWAAFVAYKCTTTEDLYPHVSPLGDIISTDQLLDGWRATVQRIREGTAPSLLGLYVHIPFCTVACTFCFCAKTDQFNRSTFDTYVDRLVQEAEVFAPVFDGLTFTSVYFGGGTPSLLSPPAMRRVFETLYRNYRVPEGTQIIFEGNPDSLSERKIEVLATVGRVNRLTIGVQTLDDDVQKIVRRFNKPHHVSDAIRACRRYGIEHVNVDLMAGLPGQTFESFQRDLEFLISLEPDSVHLNAFRPLPRVSLAQKNQEDMSPERIELRDRMMRWGSDRLRHAGHSSGMGQGNRRTADAANLQEYNLRRQNSSLLGLGFPSRSHAFGSYYYIPDTRRGMTGGIDQRNSGEMMWQAIPVDETEEHHKYLVENLRTGFERREFQELFGLDCLDVAPEAFDKLQRLGIIEIDSERIHSCVRTSGDAAIYRVFFYSPSQMRRVQRTWGADYDPSVDYRKRLEVLVENFS